MDDTNELTQSVKIFVNERIASNTITTTIEEVERFVEFCSEQLPVTGPISVYLEPKTMGGQNMSTGGYDLEKQTIKSRLEGRAIIDVLRSIAHELVHQHQQERGALNVNEPIPDIGGPIEDEANAIAGQLIKKYVLEHSARYLYQQ